MAFKQKWIKPDGRELWLYSRFPSSSEITVPSPSHERSLPNPHLRWHPLRGEWVAYADYRQTRPFLPSPEYNPLAPTRPGGPPTELPAGAYDVAVFENLSPSLSPHARPPEQRYV